MVPREHPVVLLIGSAPSAYKTMFCPDPTTLQGEIGRVEILRSAQRGVGGTGVVSRGEEDFEVCRRCGGVGGGARSSLRTSGTRKSKGLAVSRRFCNRSNGSQAGTVARTARGTRARSPVTNEMPRTRVTGICAMSSSGRRGAKFLGRLRRGCPQKPPGN